ncbi:MAG: hypothetical protein IT371_08305 [Deltaproteobacteria bacterium]|nr:hypothetical protein [Deltaproteobacteria bacterium]
MTFGRVLAGGIAAATAVFFVACAKEEVELFEVCSLAKLCKQIETGTYCCGPKAVATADPRCCPGVTYPMEVRGCDQSLSHCPKFCSTCLPYEYRYGRPRPDLGPIPDRGGPIPDRGGPIIVHPPDAG